MMTAGSPHASPASVEFRAARWLLFGTALVPIAVWPGFFFPYVTIRAVLFRVLVELATAILLYLVLRRQTSLAVRGDYVFLALAAWVVVNTLAAIFGFAPMRSLFGDHERMGGVWFWIHLLAFYVALRTFMRDQDWARYFRLCVAIAAVVAAYGLIQYWLRPFSSGIRGVEAGVTIGNSGLFAAYLLSNVTLCALLGVRAGWRARATYLAIATLLVTALVFSGNRSSTLALLGGLAVAVIAYAVWSRSLRGWRALVVALPLAAAIALPFVTRASWAQPVTARIPALSRLSSGVDSSRVIQWRAAVEGIRERPLLGVGPENYTIVWSRYYHPEMYRFLSDARWDRAHNAYLDAFATAGFFGFASLLAVFLALGVAAHRAARRERESGGTSATVAVAAGFFAAYAFYLFFWFFDLNSTMPWIALAAFVASRATTAPIASFGAPLEKRWQTTVVLLAGAVALGGVLYVHGFATLVMARKLDEVRNPGRPPEEVLADYQSVFDSPAPVTQHAFWMYAGHLASFRPRFDEIRADPRRAALFDRAFALAIKEFELQAARDPLNDRVATQHARVLMLGAYYYGSPKLYESALRRLHRAVEVAPRRVPTHLALGLAYLNVQRPVEALAAFRTAYDLYPPLAQTQEFLGRTYVALGDEREAAKWLASATRAGTLPDRWLILQVARGLLQTGAAAAAGELLTAYLEEKHGPIFLWAPGGGSSAELAADYEVAALASEAMRASGRHEPAAAIAAGSAALCSSLHELGDLSALPVAGAPPDSSRDCLAPWRNAGGYSVNSLRSE